jgi:cytolysin (calcineurin-like family phosphatase)
VTLQLVNIHQKGKQDAEYVELKAVDACNLKDFIVCDTTYTSDTTISNRFRHTYWFLPQQVAKGDYVFLRTGKGTKSSHKNQAGTTTHVIYWGSNTPIWNNTGDAAILFALKGYSVKKA